MQVTYSPLTQFLVITTPQMLNPLLINATAIEMVMPTSSGCIFHMRSYGAIMAHTLGPDPRHPKLYMMVIRALTSDCPIIVNEDDVTASASDVSAAAAAKI